MNKNLPLIATILTIFGNYYIPKLNNKGLDFVPEEYKLDVQPANWTFSIWGFIYTALIYLTYKISSGSIIWSNKSITLYLFTCAFNVLWIYFWTKKQANISQYLLIGIVVALFLLWNQNIGISSKRIYQNILSVYLAWTLGASLINIYIVNGNDNVESSKSIIYLLSAVQILWQIIYNNDINKLNDSLLFPATGVWTGLGIALNKSSSLGVLKYLPIVVSLGASINHYNEIGTPSIGKLFFN